MIEGRMLRYALRRILWSIPTLAATSLVLFFITTLVPDAPRPRSAASSASPPSTESADPASRERAMEARRATFADLPRFLNRHPQDVRTRARAAVAEVAAADATASPAALARARDAAEELQRQGGAALPYVLPALEALAPDARGRVAVTLAPVAQRMGLATQADVEQPEAAALFWTRFWDDRSLDYARTAVARAMTRLLNHGSDLREHDLVALDTFALPDVIHAMTITSDGETLARLTRIARHATGRGPVVDADASPGEARRAVADWREWWFVHATDFVVIDGSRRIAALVSETRYGKWLRRAISGQLGLSAVDGEPIETKLKSRAPVTLLVCVLALLVSWTFAVPVGALGAWRRGGTFDTASSAILFLLYATPTFAVAELLRRIAAALDLGGARVALAVAALAAGSMAATSRWQRAAMLDVVSQDFVRTAHAKGVPGWRVLVVHALRNAVMPTLSLAALHVPALLGGALVVEEVFALPGIGFETLRAVEAHDSAWLMAVILAAAGTTIVSLVASDIVHGALDPRVREVFAGRAGRRP
jgi:ABC-type dipeptide/oligopeptide/nickel transport system permease component